VYFASENRSNAQRENPYNWRAVNRDEKFGCNLVPGGFAMEVGMNTESNFEMPQEVHKRGEI
jgi:hypothetical protein